MSRYLTIVLHSVTLKAYDIIIDAEIQYAAQENNEVNYMPIMRSQLIIPPELLPADRLFEDMSLNEWTRIATEMFSLKFEFPNEKPIPDPTNLPPGDARIKFKKAVQLQSKADYREVRMRQHEQSLAMRWADICEKAEKNES